MPAGFLDTCCQQTLQDIASISQRIRFSISRHMSRREHNLNVPSGGFRTQIEAIQRTAESINEALTLQNRHLDQDLFTFVSSGELRQCLDRLKDVDAILDLDNQVRSAAEDNITRAITLFHQYRGAFQFLLPSKLSDYATQPHKQSQALDSLQNAGEAHNTHGTMMGTIAVIAYNEFIQQKLDEVIRWLAALDCTRRHVETLKLRQVGTCTWFPKTATYGVWRTGKSKFLWLCGQAGCGKSVMVASTLEYLKSTLESGEILAYFYCDFRIDRSTIATEVLRSLLSQLLRHLGSLRIDPGALPNWMLEHKRDAGALSSNDPHRLASWICHAAGRFPHKPIIVIDALDECMNAKEILDALAMLILADVRLLVTSRPEEAIEQHLRSYPALSFMEMSKELAGDMDLHVTRELDSWLELEFVDVDVKNEIRTKLHQEARGRFRWIQCQLDTLKRCHAKEELRQVLDDLPGELGTTYERILSKIDERRSEGKVARRALAWLVVALEPLRLVQLVEGLALDTHGRRIDYKTSMGPTLVHALSSLVTYNAATDVLSLSHHTVKEYLTSCTALPMYQIIPHEAHVEVIQMCLSFISFFLKRVRFHAKQAPLDSFPMLIYVFSSGFAHLGHLDPGATIILNELQSFVSNVHHYPSQWDLLCEMREEDPRRLYPPWPSSQHDLVLYLLTAYSSPTLFESLLPNHSFKLRAGTNPLVYAADLGKTMHGLLLLGHGAHVNELGLIVDDSRRALPLEVAIDLGNDVLVGELLQRGSVMPLGLITTAVCMPWCTMRVLVHLLYTDAFMEWAREMKDKEFYRRVFSSARPNAGDAVQADRDHVALARRLREVGQNLSPDSPFGAELIERALHAGRPLMLEYLLPRHTQPPPQFLIAACTANTSETVSVVRVLLKRGADIHVVSHGEEHTVLHLAAMCPWEPRALELTKILLEAGCNPATRNRQGETPMTIAVRQGYVTVLGHILPPSMSIPSHILLHAIQKRMKPQIIRFSIHRGASMDARTSSGKTALHLILMPRRSANTETWHNSDRKRVKDKVWQDLKCALSQADKGGDYYEEQCLELCKVFCESTRDSTCSGADGRLVLRLAIERKYDSVVEYLLSCNLPLPPNVLHAALQHQLALQVVQLLLRKGEDVQFRTPDGDTALHLAVTNFSEQDSLELVETFIVAGCDPASSDARGRSVLGLAIEHNYSSMVEYLLSCNLSLPPDALHTALQHRTTLRMVQLLLRTKGGNMQFKTCDRETSTLHLAVINFSERDSLELVKTFVAAGCDPTSSDARGRSVLGLAIQHNYGSVVEYLLSCNLPLPPDALHTVLRDHTTPQIIQLILCKGIELKDVQSKTHSGDTVLHLAVTNFSERESLKLVKTFIAAGCDPASSDAKGRSVLGLAIEHNYSSVAEYLLSCNLSLPPDALHTALQHCTAPQMVQLLLHKGANVQFKTHEGDTALHLAITNFSEQYSLELVETFITVGCDYISVNAKGISALRLAIKHKYHSMVERLLSKSCSLPLPSDILYTALRDRTTPQIVQLILCKCGLEAVQFKAYNGDTVLHLAVTNFSSEQESLELVKIFVSAGCETCDPTSSNTNGRSALGLAIKQKYGSVVECLLSCNLPLPPVVLHTALQDCTTPQIVQLILHKGVKLRDMQSKTHSGDTVLHLAVTKFSKRESLSLVKAFIAAGCDPASTNDSGKSALGLAIERKYISVMKYLLSCNVTLPPDALCTALQHRSTLKPEVVQIFLRKSADVGSQNLKRTYDEAILDN